MSAVLSAPTHLEEVLDRSREHARVTGLPYAGGVSPDEAWALFSSGAAVLVDVRTAEERKFVGHVPESLHVPWATGTSLTRNPRFVKELETKVGGKDRVLLLCRSGKRSALGARRRSRRQGRPGERLQCFRGFRRRIERARPARPARWLAPQRPAMDSGLTSITRASREQPEPHHEPDLHRQLAVHRPHAADSPEPRHRGRSCRTATPASTSTLAPTSGRASSSTTAPVW